MVVCVVTSGEVRLAERYSASARMAMGDDGDGWAGTVPAFARVRRLSRILGSLVWRGTLCGGSPRAARAAPRRLSRFRCARKLPSLFCACSPRREDGRGGRLAAKRRQWSEWTGTITRVHACIHSTCRSLGGLAVRARAMTGFCVREHSCAGHSRRGEGVALTHAFTQQTNLEPLFSLCYFH